MIITTIRVMKINHISVSMSEEFAKQKVNKFFISHFRKHCGKCGGLNVGFAESPANVSLIGIDTVLFTTALIGNSLEHLNVHVLNLFQDGLAEFAEFGVVHGDLPVDALIIDQKDGTTSFLSPVSEVSIWSIRECNL